VGSRLELREPTPMRNSIALSLIILWFVGCASVDETPQISYSYAGIPCPEIPSQFQWKNVYVKTEYSILALAMMDDDDLYLNITGGTPFTSNIYDWNGKMYSQTINKKKEILRIIDMSNNCPIGFDEWSKRDIKYKSQTDAPGIKQKYNLK
jgi:hypothetical protein